MKPFDLEAAKRGEPIVTRDGREAKFIAHVPEAKDSLKLIIRVGSEVFGTRNNGAYGNGNRENAFDLFMAPKNRTVWVNLYPDSITGVYWCNSEEEANRMNNSGTRIGGKAYPVEVEE